MTVVIAGGGDIAYLLASSLAREEDVFVVLPTETVRGRFEHLDLQITVGPAASRTTLNQVGLSDRDTFIACADSDERNIIACLAARGRSKATTYCFISQDEHYESFNDPEQTTLEEVIDHLIWPQWSLAREIARIVLEPRALDVENFHRGRVWLMEYRLQADSPLCGPTLAEAPLPRNTLVVSRVRNGELIVPRGQDRLEAGDKVLFMGRRTALRQVAKRFFAAPETVVRSVTIIGGGRTGRLLAQELTRGLWPEVRVIEVSRRRCEDIAGQVGRAIVFCGDGTDLKVLEEVGVARSDALVAMAGDDQTNLLCSLIAKQLGIPKVVTGVSHDTSSALFERVGIDVTLNARAAAIAEVLHQIQAPRLEYRATLEDGRAEVVEIAVPPDFEARRLREMDMPTGVIVGAVLRQYNTIVPGGGDEVRPGDRLLVVAAAEAADTVGPAFGLAPEAD